MADCYNVALTASIVSVLENPTARKKQLLSLYSLIIRESNPLREAIRTDLSWTDEVTIAAINHVLGAIESLYSDVSLEHELALEQKISTGNTVEHCKLPLGLTLIIGSGENPLGSMLLPLVGALAAGSISIIVQPDGMDNVSAAISSILRNAVDHEGLQTVPASALPALLKRRFDVVAIPPSFDTKAVKQLQSANAAIRVLQPGAGLVAAIVDRSADIYSASVHIRNSLWKNNAEGLFGGPKIIFVDEFVLDDLREHLLDRQKGVTGYRATKPSAKPSTEVLWISARSQGSFASAPVPVPLTPDYLKKLVSNPHGATGSIALLPTTSSDQTLSLLNFVNGQKVSPAVYVFSGGTELAFFSRFVCSQVTIANSMPTWALVNWIPQSSHATSSLPFSPHDFASNHPVVQYGPVKKESDLPRVAIKKAVLKDVKRKEQGLGFSFFEKGIALGGIGMLLSAGGAVYIAICGLTLLTPLVKARY